MFKFAITTAAAAALRAWDLHQIRPKRAAGITTLPGRTNITGATVDLLSSVGLQATARFGTTMTARPGARIGSRCDGTTAPGPERGMSCCGCNRTVSVYELIAATNVLRATTTVRDGSLLFTPVRTDY
jgi:hypothetical protein